MARLDPLPVPKYETLEDILVDCLDAIEPPDRLTVSEAAAKYRHINVPGAYVGPWDNDIAPYLVEIMDTLDSEDHTGMVIVGPARCGKSDILFNWLVKLTILDPGNLMVVHMKKNTARDWAKEDFAKFLRDTPEVAAKMDTARDSDNVHDKAFRSMRVYNKYPVVEELSGKTVRYVWLNDFDRMPLDIDGEGSPWVLGKKRTTTFKRFGMTVAEASPGYPCKENAWRKKTPHQAPPCDGLVALYNQGDRRRRYWQCPKCNGWFIPTFDLLVYDDGDDIEERAKSVMLQCPHQTCGHRIPQTMKNHLDRRGRWLRDNQRMLPDGSVDGAGTVSDIASFWIPPLAAFAQDWISLTRNYLRALEQFKLTNDDTLLKSTINTDQGEVYTPKALTGEVRLPEVVKANCAEDYGIAERPVVPDDVRFLLATVDVQTNRFIVQVHGFRPSPNPTGVGDIVVIDRFEITKGTRTDADDQPLWLKPASFLEDWMLLIKQVMLKTYPLDDDSGRVMQVLQTAVDSGGEGTTTSKAYDFWRYLRDGPEDQNASDDGWYPGCHDRLILLKGERGSRTYRQKIEYPDSVQRDRFSGARGEVPVMFVNNTSIKDSIMGMVDRTEAGGKIVTPSHFEDSWYVELLVETRTVAGWENEKKRRNESFDLLCYALALSLSLRVRIESINWTSPPGWAAEWDENDMVSKAESAPRFEAAKEIANVSLAALGKRLS